MPLPQDSADPIAPFFLTQEELAEISTRKIRIELSPERAHQSKNELAAIDTKNMNAALSADLANPTDLLIQPALDKPAHPVRDMVSYWYAAFKKIFPVYAAIHVALLAISCLAFLYTDHDFAAKIMPLSTLWTQWHHWDTGLYLQIALHGYVQSTQMAFFPLYPTLERALMTITGDPFTAGLIISNGAELIMFTVLYRLIEQDFGGERAFHTVLYFAIFPTAFFFSIAYTEATFLCFSVLTFYQIRRHRWWSATLFGFLACLTRPDGMFLVIPFCYEYLRNKWPPEATSLRALFSRRLIIALLKSIRFDILICIGIPMGILCVMAYGYYRFGDPLAFFHAHASWGRFMAIPGYNMLKSLWAIYKHGVMSFTTMRSLTDLLPDLIVGTLILLCFIGKWRLPLKLWSYGLYALVLYTYLQIFVKGGDFSLESMSRFLLELFPAFIILSQIRKSRLLHLSYFMLALAVFFFLSTQFATGHWVL
ncbi:MAG TPA: mannosyltransferase family protein [Ktedonobacteraceae bacterium]|jgi:hypothetical protein